MKRKYLLLEFLQSNDGKVYAFVYDQETSRCLNFQFFEWLEILPNLRAVVFDDHDENCDDCFYKQEHDEGKDDEFEL